MKVDLLNDRITVFSKNIGSANNPERSVELYEDTTSFSDEKVAFMTFTERQSRVFNKLLDHNENVHPSIF